MYQRKGPAFAGLFFALNILGALHAADLPRLTTHDQNYFRRFVEIFTPTLLGREHRKSAAATRPQGSVAHANHSAGQAGNYRWDKKNRDCAGLVRYVFWEAMQQHNETFLQQYPEVRAIATDPSPAILRLRPAWGHDNLNAAQLIARSRPLGRGVPAATLKTGDLLYFQSGELKIRHVMLVVRSGAAVFLVYHTGDDRDELRIRTFADMIALPESHWHPEAQNPVFRGVYRPQFLE